MEHKEKRYSPYLFAVTDIVFSLIAFLFAVVMIDASRIVTEGIWREVLSNAFIFYALSMLFQIVFKCWKPMWTKANIDDYLNLLVASIATGVADFVLCMLLKPVMLPVKDNILGILTALGFIIVSRVILKYIGRYLNIIMLKTYNPNLKNLLIVGAGVAAKILISDIIDIKSQKYNIVGFIDDDLNKRNYSYLGYKVLGNRNDIIRICEEKLVDEIIVAIPSGHKDDVSEIVDICSKTVCKVKIIPGVYSAVKSPKGILKKARDVEIEDLLPRTEIRLDNSEISQNLNDKVVLVTGGGGSIGSELCRQIVKFNPQQLIIVDIYENNAYDLQNELKFDYPYLNMEVLIASVRDYDRIDAIFKKYNPYIIFHAAAHKHVPLMEDSPGEAIKNNILGTYNVAKCANENKIEKFVMISTDKAVNPTNVMGATKKFCEMIVESFNRESVTKFAIVRFGNVLGSNGSVIPLFKKQIANGGPVTVTHKEITRYFMTIPEAAQLVLQASSYANGGEIFVLDMGRPVKIYDLAVNIIKLSGFVPDEDIKIEVTGLRAGEKLYEELLTSEDGLKGTYNKSIFVAKPHSIKMTEIIEKIEDLKKAIESHDNEVIIEALHKAVPTFVAADEFNAQNR